MSIFDEKQLDSLGNDWFRSVVNNLNDAILITEAEPFDLPGPRILWANDVFYQSTGYEPADIIGQTPRILQGPLTDRSALKRLRTALEKWEVCRVEILNYKKDGSTFWNEFEVTPITNEVGFVTHWVAVQRDITERKRFEEALKISESRFRLVSETAPIGLFTTDAQGSCTYSNACWQQIFGLSFEQALGGGWQSGIHLADKEKVVDNWVLNASKKSVFDVQFRTQHQDGSIRFVHSIAKPIVSDDGDVLGYVGTVSDITENKQKETEVIAAQSELRFQKHALDEHAIVSIADAAGNITYVNDKFCAISGYSRDELLGKNHKIIKSKEHPDAFFVNLWKTISSGQTWHGDIKNTSKTGNHYWVTTTIVPTLGANGKPYQYVGIRTEITERMNVEARLKQMAYSDLLTALPNRALLADRLDNAMAQHHRHHKPLAVAFMDLDGFKAINDTYSHDVGDKLLVAVSQRMKAALREGDTLARIGGDEFVAIMCDLVSIEDTGPALERLLKTVSDPLVIDGHTLQISMSIGVTLYPEDHSEAEQLIRHADQAMYVAKQAGKNRFHVFDTAQNIAIQLRCKHLDSIRLALDNNEFVLHYQPKVNMRTGDVIGVEALIRWQHPERGLVPPLAFLPLIEGHMLSVELGEWVIDAALRQIAQWQSLGLILPISVNISAHQLQQDNFTARLAALLSAHPEVPSEYLELEILETSALQDTNQVSQTMNACHELGVCFALDDFGTGYSSLTYLKRLPAYLIKIDQSFVRDMLKDADDLAIVQGVMGLTKVFRRDVIAEGVETIAHGMALLGLGCELAQGYGIAKPMPASDISDWVANWTPDKSWKLSSRTVE
jgi:diguanylate cyclase (GGDEF)-like protein/PAS domain S-box-containing protein